MTTEPTKAPATPPGPAPSTPSATPSALAQAEPDQLGSLAAIATAHVDDLRMTLVTAFRDAIAEAQTAARTPAIGEAVHELRKALRRARATVHLVRDTLARDDRRDLTRALGDARQLLSATRDLDVAPGALAAVALDLDTREVADAIIAHARHTAPPLDEIRRHVQDAASRVAHLGDVMAAALPPAIDLGDVRDGIAATYRRARQNLKKARRSHLEFHRFRKRAKELAYQLELLAGGVEGRTEAMRRELAELGDELGIVVDVIMLRGFLEHHAPAELPAAEGETNGESAPSPLAGVLAAIDGDLEGRVRAARKRSRGLFERTPRRFARKVRRAVRRDHEPPAAPDDEPAPPVAQA